MHRWWLPLALLCLPACRNDTVSPEDSLRHQKFDDAAAVTKAALERAPDDWHFRLLNVEIQLGRRLAPQALNQLDEYGPAPPDQVGRALMLRGQALYTLGRLPEAEDALARAAEAARATHSAPLSAEVQLRRGTLLAMQSRFDEAQRTLEDVLDASTRLHDPYLAARAASNLGFTLLSASRYDEAIPAYERARKFALAAGASESVARADGNLGACYARLGDYDNAAIYYERAQQAFEKTGNRDEQQAWIGNAGNLHLDSGDYAGAIQPYKRALQLARAIPDNVWAARWLSNLASTYIGLEDWETAEKYYKQALELKQQLNDTSYQANSVINAARIAAGRGRTSDAEQLYRQALTQPSEDPTVQLEAHAGLARIFIQTSQAKKAEAEFRTAIEALDRRGATLLKDEYRLSWLSSLIRFYRLYVDFLLDSNQPDHALEIAESSRARVLASAAYTPRQVKDYQRLAQQSNAVLLEYWPGSLWVITPQQTFHHAIPPSGDLHPLIERYRAVTVAGRNPLDVAGDVGHKLYDTLVAPAMRDAPGATRFIVVPDEDLYSFNLETLPSAKDDRKFWLEDATVAMAPSLNYLASAPTVHPQGGILLIGDPDATPQYPRLEFANQEMDSIASAMAGWESTVIKGAAARSESYAGASPGRFSFIHFAAHATANQINPLDSAVILSGGKLPAREVMGHPLTARLVTVSACRSAGGKTYAGEGLVGFAWSFLRAGAGNVIAGLWDVNDRSTADLMTRLYSEIAAGSPVADSLRTAKLAVLHKGGAYAKPFYWAPFELFMGRSE